MSDISAYKETAEKLTAVETFNARLRTLTAKPLTGFLLTEEDLQVAGPLLQSIFSTKVDEKSIEDILNGK
ncbi:hypothetical protein [Desulfotalea psychrophila]|uniref:hypothetical protein n=1 Tax=Desulfotalea psychrophila TaxID=84980 RepID=UPI00059C1C55|nr:hypothetical protein [Desulfotalea psychrophila]